VGKIILFIALALVVYLVIQGMIRARRRPSASERPPERMVACWRCGVNLPQSEAMEADGHFFCSESHRRGEG